MNLVILAAGQETMLQLLQWRSLLKHAVKRTWINVNSRSKRYLDALKEPHEFERAFMFGYYAPVSCCSIIITICIHQSPTSPFALVSRLHALDSLIWSHDWNDVRLHFSINAWVSKQGNDATQLFFSLTLFASLYLQRMCNLLLDCNKSKYSQWCVTALICTLSY
jgi:hypothetical protein